MEKDEEDGRNSWREIWGCTEKNNVKKSDRCASRSEKARFELHVREGAPDLHEGLGEEEHERNF